MSGKTKKYIFFVLILFIFIVSSSFIGGHCLNHFLNRSQIITESTERSQEIRDEININHKMRMESLNKIIDKFKIND